MDSRAPAGELTFWVEQTGRGAPVLLISGLGYSSWCWTELRDALQADFRVVTFDNRGTGRSSKPPGPYSMAMLADDAARVLERCDLADAHVLGHSMGGYIALHLALRHPKKVRSLILVGTSRGGRDTEPVPEETQADWTRYRGLPPAEYARSTMPHSFAPGWTDAHPERFEHYLEERLRHPTPPEAWLAQYLACVDHVIRGVDVRGVGVPALVMHGTADRVVPYRNGELLARSLPAAEWVSLEGAGHLPYLEDPPGFAARVRAFLARQRA